jgi:hypothetical protein
VRGCGEGDVRNWVRDSVGMRSKRSARATQEQGAAAGLARKGPQLHSEEQNACVQQGMCVQ